MPITIDYGPSYEARGQLAREAGSSVAARENLDRSIGRQMQQDELGSQMALAYDQMTARMAENEMNRQQQQQQFGYDRMYRDYRAERDAQLAQAAAAEQADRQQKLQSAGLQERYTMQQQQEKDRIQNAISAIESHPTLRPQEKQALVAKARLQLAGIQPEYVPVDQPETQDIGGKKFWKVEGRGGRVEYLDPDTGVSSEKLFDAQREAEDRDTKSRMAEQESRARLYLETVKIVNSMTKVNADGISVPAFSDPKQAAEVAERMFQSALERMGGQAPPADGQDPQPQTAAPGSTPYDDLILKYGEDLSKWPAEALKAIGAQ